jgi:hypothetical protein
MMTKEKSSRRAAWLKEHLPALLFGWFWVGMILCGLLAPADRVLELQSGLITEGWHLSVMAGVFGTVILSLYIRRCAPPKKIT